MQEANCINKSLTFLEQAVNALSRREAHVPYRQSKLTSVLRDALGGNCRTVGFHSDPVQSKKPGDVLFLNQPRTLAPDQADQHSQGHPAGSMQMEAETLL